MASIGAVRARSDSPMAAPFSAVETSGLPRPAVTAVEAPRSRVVDAVALPLRETGSPVPLRIRPMEQGYHPIGIVGSRGCRPKDQDNRRRRSHGSTAPAERQYSHSESSVPAGAVPRIKTIADAGATDRRHRPSGILAS